jgi:phospholipase C
VPVPNISAWRNSTVGDMTSAFNFAIPPDPSRPNLEHPALAAFPKLTQCFPNLVLGTAAAAGVPYRVPCLQAMPTQESGPARPKPSGIC